MSVVVHSFPPVDTLDGPAAGDLVGLQDLLEVSLQPASADGISCHPSRHTGRDSHIGEFLDIPRDSRQLSLAETFNQPRSTGDGRMVDAMNDAGTLP